jgi:hypothetical protein
LRARLVSACCASRAERGASAPVSPCLRLSPRERAFSACSALQRVPRPISIGVDLHRDCPLGRDRVPGPRPARCLVHSRNH